MLYLNGVQIIIRSYQCPLQMANSQLIKELMSEIYNIESESFEILNEISMAKSKVAFPLSAEEDFVSQYCEISYKDPTFGDIQEFPGESVKSEIEYQRQKSSKVMSQKGLLNHPYYTVSELSRASDTSERDLETVLVENSSLRRKISRMEAKLQKYKEVIATLTKHINTQ